MKKEPVTVTYEIRENEKSKTEKKVLNGSKQAIDFVSKLMDSETKDRKIGKITLD